MLTFKLKVVKLYVYVRTSINIFKEENDSKNFHPKDIHTEILLRRYERWKRRQTCHTILQFPLFPPFRFHFSAQIFLPWRMVIYVHAKSFLPQKLEKKRSIPLFIFPLPPSDSLVCIYGGGPLCLKSSQPSLLLARHAEYGGKHKVSEQNN